MPVGLLHTMQLACLALLILPAARVIAAEDRPNVLLILGDDQAWTDFGFMGHSVIQTPHLDRLAAESACFSRGYVPSSLCRPSLATLITGRYPHEHKISGNDPPTGINRGAMLKHIRQIPTLPRWLGEQGYASFQAGKWWEGTPADGGFSSGMTHGDPRRGGRHGDEGLKIGREGHAPIARFVESHREQHWFLWHAPFLPHTPHNPPERLLKKYLVEERPVSIARYYAMCEWFDETLGELLSMLDERGLKEKTLVIFVTDNGWIQDPAGNGFLPRSKRSPYDGGLRTPILVRWPGHVRPGRYDLPVSSVDIAPTILAACGITPREPLPGENLLQIAAAGGQSSRTALYGEIFNHDVADIDQPSRSLQYRWILGDGRWKLIQPQNPAETPGLYDVLEDPFEKQNLAVAEPARVRELQTRLDAWWNPE